MKSRYILLQAFVILSAGLISCSSENSSEIPETPFKISPEIQNTDNTIQRVQGSHTVRASSNIALGIEPGEFTKGHILASVSCKTNFLQELPEKETLLEPATHIFIKDILPSKVFRPTTEENKDVKCDVRLDINNNSDLTVIKLLGIKVLNIDDLANAELEFINPDTLIYHRKELVKEGITAPMALGEVETLCDRASFFSFINQSQNTLNDFINESLFENTNVLNCRLLFRKEKSHEVWVSQIFKIQNESANLRITRHRKWISNANINYENDIPFFYTIQNRGRAPAYVRLSLPQTSVLMTPVYKSGGEKVFRTNGSVRMAARWTYDGVVLKEKNSGALILEPGESMEVQLVVNGSAECSLGSPVLQNAPRNCSTDLQLIGNEYLISKFPKIIESQFADPSLNKWKTTNLQEVQKKQGRRIRGHWTPYKQIKKLCPKWIPLKKLKSPYTPMIPQMKSIIRCQ